MKPWFAGRGAERSPADSAGSGRPAARPWWADALHLFVLSSFAVAHPIYDRLGERGAFLVDRGTRPGAVFLLVGLVSLALPAALALLELAARRVGRRLPEALHAILVFTLMGLTALPACKRLTFLPGPFMVAAALLAAVVGCWIYFHFARARMLVTAASPGILVFPAVLLLHSSVTGVLFPPRFVSGAPIGRTPVVVVVFDELCGASLRNTEREIDAHRFPNFAALSQDAAWFRNATTVHVDTWQAVPAILSSRYPPFFWPPLPADLPQNLFSVHESSWGYDLAVFEPVSSLAPRKRDAAKAGAAAPWTQCQGLIDTLGRVYLYHLLPEDYAPRLPKIPDLWFGMRNAELVDQAGQQGVFRYAWGEQRSRQIQHFLDCIDGERPTTLYFMHVLLPHVPWCFLPSGRRYAPDEGSFDLINFNGHGVLGDFWVQDDWIVTQYQQRYLLQLQSVDRELGRIVDRLKQAGIYDQCLLVVAADHGVSFRPSQPRRTVSDANIADILSVPLFVKRPGQTHAGASDARVESIDILPTIADCLGVKLLEPVDGRSVFDDSAPARVEIHYAVDYRTFTADPATIAQTDLPAQIAARFGDSRDPDAIFRIGPMPELIGREASAFDHSSEARFELDLTRFGDTLDDDPESVVPCYFEGEVVSPAPGNEPVVLAVAVNGTIRAVTQTSRLKPIASHWSALLPESAFHSGKNDVQFYSVTGTGDAVRLDPCTARLATR